MQRLSLILALKKCAEVVRSQYETGIVNRATVLAAEALGKEAEISASRLKERIAARDPQRKK
jgi:hypothetical protein